jgi:hypothetical protein
VVEGARLESVFSNYAAAHVNTKYSWLRPRDLLQGALRVARRLPDQRPSFDEICTKKPSGSLRLTVDPPVFA